MSFICFTVFKWTLSALGCASSEFECSNGDCIDDSLECDGYDQCGDKSDEQNCGIPLTGLLENILMLLCI